MSEANRKSCWGKGKTGIFIAPGKSLTPSPLAAAHPPYLSLPSSHRSLTLPNVKFVIDSGLCKLPWYDCERGVERLVVSAGSKSNARQRAGRAGRVSRGKCYRLYTRRAYDGMEDSTKPEIQRTPLANLVLTLKMLGVENIARFKMLTPPTVSALEEALEELYALGAIDDKCIVIEGVGDVMAELPVDVKMSRSIIEGFKVGCLEEVIAVASCCQVNGVFLKPRSAQQGRDRDVVVGEMARGGGDHVVYARILEGEDWRGGGWCRERFINQRAVKKADEIRGQLRRLCSQMCGGGRLSSMGTEEEGERGVLRR